MWGITIPWLFLTNHCSEMKRAGLRSTFRCSMAFGFVLLFKEFAMCFSFSESVNIYEAPSTSPGTVLGSRQPVTKQHPAQAGLDQVGEEKSNNKYIKYATSSRR